VSPSATIASPVTLSGVRSATDGWNAGSNAIGTLGISCAMAMAPRVQNPCSLTVARNTPGIDGVPTGRVTGTSPGSSFSSNPKYATTGRPSGFVTIEG
jgi:hypothetical protein